MEVKNEDPTKRYRSFEIVAQRVGSENRVLILTFFSIFELLLLDMFIMVKFIDQN